MSSQPPPVDSPVLPCGKKALPCCPVKLRVACGHGDRGYILDVPGPKTRNGRPVLQLVADQLFRPGQGPGATPVATGSSGEYTLRDYIRVDLIATSCQRGKPSAVGPGPWTVIGDRESRDVWPAVTVSGSGVNTLGAAPYAVSAYSQGLPPMLGDGRSAPWIGLDTFLRHFLLPQGPVTYSVGVRSCEGDPRFVADIEVFPKQSWSGEIGFAYGSEDELSYKEFKSSKDKRRRDPNAKQKGQEFNTTKREWKVSCGMSVTYADQKIEVKAPLDEFNYVRTATQFVRRVDDIQKLSQGANALTGISAKFEPKYPAIKLSGTVERKEKKGSWDVEMEGSVKLAFEPIIGLGVEIDLLDALITAAGAATGAIALTKVLLKAKKAAEESRLCEVSLKLSGEGTIFGEIGWKGTNLMPEEGKAGGALGLKLEGVVAVASEWWNVAAGAAMGGETKFTFTGKPVKKEKLTLETKYEWTGITVYYSVYVSRTSGETVGKPSRSISEQTKDSVGEVSRKREVQIVDKWEYPAEASTGKPTGESSGVGEYLT